jgi:hypothetical protein
MRHQIKALKTTIDAQARSLEAVDRVNKAALALVKAFDPERFAKQMTIYKDLVDRNTTALLEDDRQRANRNLDSLHKGLGGRLSGRRFSAHIRTIWAATPSDPRGGSAR